MRGRGVWGGLGVGVGVWGGVQARRRCPRPLGAVRTPTLGLGLRDYHQGGEPSIISPVPTPAPERVQRRNWVPGGLPWERIPPGSGLPICARAATAEIAAEVGRGVSAQGVLSGEGSGGGVRRGCEEGWGVRGGRQPPWEGVLWDPSLPDR